MGNDGGNVPATISDVENGRRKLPAGIPDMEKAAGNSPAAFPDAPKGQMFHRRTGRNMHERDRENAATNIEQQNIFPRWIRINEELFEGGVYQCEFLTAPQKAHSSFTPYSLTPMKSFQAAKFLVLSVSLSVAGLLASAQATTYTWTQAGGVTSQSWSLDTNWSPNTTTGGVDTAGDIAIINTNITGTQTISLFNTGDAGDATKTVGRLDFGDTNSTSPFIIQAGSGGGVLNFDNSGNGAQLNRLSTGSASDSITANVTLSDNLTISNASSANTTLISGSITAATAGTKTIINSGTGTGTVTLSGIIGNGTGTVAITQNSVNGTLALSNANTFSGGVAISAGTVLISNATALGSGTTTLGATGSSAAATLNSGSNLTAANAITVASGAGTRTITGSGGG